MEEVVNELSQLEQELVRLRAENRALKRSQQLFLDAGHQSDLHNSELTGNLHGAKSVVYVKDLAGRYMQVNQHFEEITKKSRAEVLGRTDKEIFGDDHGLTFDSTDQAVKSLKQEIEFEELIPHGDQLHTYITQKIPLIDDKGELYAICAISTDLSEREQILDDLSQIRRQHEEAQRLAQLGHWYFDIKNNKLNWSPEIFNIFGIDSQKFNASYENFIAAVHPDDRDYVNQAYQDSVANHQPYDITHRLLMKDGSIKHVRERCETVYDYDEQPVCSIGTVQDVSQFKQAETSLVTACKDLELQLENRSDNLREMSMQISEAVQNLVKTKSMLRQERDFIDSLIETAPTIILLLKPDGKIERFNTYLEVLTGYSQEEVINADWFDTFIPEHERAGLRDFFQQICEGPITDNKTGHVNQIQSKSGKKFLIEWHNRLLMDNKGNVERILAIGRDVTEQKLTEQELKRRNKILMAVSKMSQNLLKSGGWQYWGYDGLTSLGKAADVSRAYMLKCETYQVHDYACRRHLEWCAEGISSLIDTGQIPGLDRYSRGFQQWRDQLADGKVKCLRKSDCTEQEREYFELDDVLSLLIVPLFFEGQFWGFLGFDDCSYERIWTDAEIAALQTAAGVISSAMELELAGIEKHASMQRFQDIVESTNDWIWEVDANGVYTYASPAVEKILGYTAGEVLGKTPFELMPAQEAERVSKEFAQISADRRAFYGLENVNYHKDGYLVYLETNGVPIFDNAGNPVGYRGIDRDVSDRKAAEGKRLHLLARQKDELVMEVHHRIKNHLQGLIGLLRQRKNSDASHDEILNEAISQIDSIAVVYGLQAYQAGAKIHFKQMLDAIIRSAAGLTDINFSQTEALEEGLCEVDREKAVALALVINELLMNAIKHFQCRNDTNSITITHDHRRGKIILLISNPGKLPDGFDLDSGLGLGTGLELASAMLPSNGAKLKLSQSGDEVVAELEIGPPLLIGADHF